MKKINFLRQFKGFFISSFKMQLRNGTSLFFSFFFPVLFIVIFGLLNTEVISNDLKIGLIPSESVAYSDLRKPLTQSKMIKIEENESGEYLEKRLKNGKIHGILEFGDNQVILKTDPSDEETNKIVYNAIEGIINEQAVKENKLQTNWQLLEKDVEVKNTTYLDYLLPGILGFTILTRAISATSLNFVSLRKNLALKRILVTPVSKKAMMLGQSFSRLIFGLLQSVILIGAAWAIFDSKPLEEWAGVWQIIPIIILGSIVFLGLGYVTAAIVRKEETIGPLNTFIIYPQILLAGTFFSIENFPDWLQKVSSFLPLYNLNEGLRLIYLDGLNLLNKEVLIQVGGLFIWSILIYLLATKTLKNRKI